MYAIYMWVSEYKGPVPCQLLYFLLQITLKKLSYAGLNKCHGQGWAEEEKDYGPWTQTNNMNQDE